MNNQKLLYLLPLGKILDVRLYLDQQLEDSSDVYLWPFHLPRILRQLEHLKNAAQASANQATPT